MSGQGQVPVQSESKFISKQLCLIAAITCIAGFAVDMLVSSTPLDPFALEWRINFLQQAGDRSIVFFFGIALLLYSVFDSQRLRRPLSFICLAIGVAMLLSSILVIRDSLILRDQSLNNITAQSEQLQSQIDETRDSGELPPDITIDQLQQASQQIASQTQAVKQTATQTITRAGTASVGNLMVVGFGLVGLSRIGMSRK